MHRILRDLIENIDTRQAYVDSALAPLPVDRLRQRPAPKKWSILEIVEHLAKAADLYTPGLGRAVAKGRAKGWTGPDDLPLKRGIVAGYLRDIMVSPKPAPTTGSFKPAPPASLDPAEVFGHFRAAHQTLRSVAESAAGLHLNKMRLRNPILPIFTQCAGISFEILHLHLTRHIGQIEAILATSAAE